MSLSVPRLYATLLLGLLAPAPTWAGPLPEPAPGVHPPETPAPAEGAAPVTMSLAEALEIALVRSYAVQAARLDLDTSASRIEAAWGSVYPRVDLDARYVRNVRVANPFAGSSAGGFFSGLDAIGWLAYNEGARQANQPALDLIEYQSRVAAAQRAAGLAAPDPDANPFLVENVVSATISIQQTLYNGAAFAAIRGAETYQAQAESQVREAQQRVAREVAVAFLRAQLAAAQVTVLDQSVVRTRETVAEVNGKVEQGVLPKFQALSAEVELANLENRRLQAAAAEQAALDGLKLAIGLPPDTELQLRDRLDPAAVPPPVNLDAGAALQEAIARRPDLEGLRRRQQTAAVAVELAEANHLPVVSFFANVGVTGNVPDHREVGIADPQDPFSYRREVLSPFASDYWFDTFNLGLSLTWNLFNGFQTTEQIQQARIDGRRLDVQYQQTLDGVRADLRIALRDLKTARDRLATVERTLERAQLNYAHTKARVDEGVSTQLELRDANQQLDETWFTRLQAVHDWLEARVRYHIAVGAPPGELPGAAPPTPAPPPAEPAAEPAAPPPAAPATPPPAAPLDAPAASRPSVPAASGDPSRSTP